MIVTQNQAKPVEIVLWFLDSIGCPQDLYILKGKNLNNQRFFCEPDNQKTFRQIHCIGWKKTNQDTIQKKHK